jgi:uncharacterized protein
MAVTYLDSSAIVKLAVRESESVALRRYLRRRRPLVSSSLARTEVMRALMPGGDDAVAAGRKVLIRLDLIRISTGVLGDAAVLLPTDLRSLDAIHLATARRLGQDLGAIVTYDELMAEAATHLGHRIVAPR